MSPESEVGAFFEVLYQSGVYWKFLGLSQVMAGLLVLVPASAAIGALLFFGIMVNIFLITLSYDFSGTPIITFFMLLATVWLLLWDYHRFRGILFTPDVSNANTADSYHTNLPQPALKNQFERAVYVVGTFSGIVLFSMLRGLALPTGTHVVSLALCVLCFFTAVILGVCYANKPIYHN
jgi:hypothetical protein